MTSQLHLNGLSMRGCHHVFLSSSSSLMMFLFVIPLIFNKIQIQHLWIGGVSDLSILSPLLPPVQAFNGCIQKVGKSSAITNTITITISTTTTTIINITTTIVYRQVLSNGLSLDLVASAEAGNNISPCNHPCQVGDHDNGDHHDHGDDPGDDDHDNGDDPGYHDPGDDENYNGEWF